MRVCDFCREPRKLTEIIIPERNFYYTEKIKVSFSKHEICDECALILADKITEWMKEEKDED
jgi:hypothetical protein